MTTTHSDNHPDLDAPVEQARSARDVEVTEQTRRVVEAFFDRLESGEGISDMFAESVDHYVPGAETVPWTGRRSTRAQVTEFFNVLGQYLAPRSLDLSQVVVQGSDGIALGRFEYTVRSNGRPFEGQFALHLTITDGLIVRYHMYEDSYALERAISGH